MQKENDGSLNTTGLSSNNITCLHTHLSEQKHALRNTQILQEKTRDTDNCYLKYKLVTNRLQEKLCVLTDRHCHFRRNAQTQFGILWSLLYFKMADLKNTEVKHFNGECKTFRSMNLELNASKIIWMNGLKKTMQIKQMIY